MPLYRFEHPKSDGTGPFIDVFQKMEGSHEYVDEEGVEWFDSADVGDTCPAPAQVRLAGRQQLVRQLRIFVSPAQHQHMGGAHRGIEIGASLVGTKACVHEADWHIVARGDNQTTAVKMHLRKNRVLQQRGRHRLEHPALGRLAAPNLREMWWVVIAERPKAVHGR